MPKYVERNRETVSPNIQATRADIKERHLKRSRLAQHSCVENCRILRKEAKILEVGKNSVYRKIRKRPTCLVYKIYQPTQHWSFSQLVSFDQEEVVLKILPFGILRSGRSCPNDTFYPMMIHHVPADGVSGVRILNSCVTVQCVVWGLISQSSWLFVTASMVSIFGVFLALFFSFVAYNFFCALFPLQPLDMYFYRYLSTLVEYFFSTQ